MSDIKELYQQIILDHNRNPSNFHEMENATHKAEGYNPLCGDRYTVYLHVKDEKVQKVSFHGSGCAISTSSASIMTELLENKEVKEAKKIMVEFQNMLKDGKGNKASDKSESDSSLGKAIALEGVKEFPTRLKCATLAWHTFKAALETGSDK